MSQQRFRRLTDLFVHGKDILLPDGSLLWIQAINAYERDECISDAQVARARLVLALRDKGQERVKIEARMAERGRDAMIVDVVQAKVDAKYPEIVNSLESDPDWTERLSILRRSDFTQQAAPVSRDEEDLVSKILTEWTDTVADKVEEERQWLDNYYARASDEQILDDYLELYLERRGTEIASAEYALTEIWYATRYCDGVRSDDNPTDHTRCNGHPDRVFDTKADARSAPDKLQQLITSALADLAMGDRDPKGSGNPTSSSGSSPTPAAPEASTPSTSTATPETLPGI